MPWSPAGGCTPLSLDPPIHGRRQRYPWECRKNQIPDGPQLRFRGLNLPSILWPRSNFLSRGPYAAPSPTQKPRSSILSSGGLDTKPFMNVLTETEKYRCTSIASTSRPFKTPPTTRQDHPGGLFHFSLTGFSGRVNSKNFSTAGKF